MKPIKMLGKQIERLEKKIDEILPLVAEARKVPVLESRMDCIPEMRAKIARVPDIEKKADEGVKLRWQFVGAYAATSIVIQFFFSYLLRP